MPRITIVGLNYAPEPSGNAPYTTSLAEHLARADWSVDVITGFPHYPDWKKSKASRRETLNGADVHRISHYVPSDPTTLRRGLMEMSWMAAGAVRLVRRPSTDIVLGVVPSLSGAWLALATARRAHAPCVLWIQDLMGQAARQSGIGGGERVADLVKAVELAVARRADAVAIVSPGFEPYLVDGGVSPDRVFLTSNWGLLPPPAKDRETTRSALDLPIATPLAVHSGNMGLKQGLGIVLEVASVLPDVTFLLQGNGSERDRIHTRAESMGLTNVQFRDSLAAQDLADLLASADTLLLTQRPSVTDMSLPSKLTSYFGACRPIVASVSLQSEAAAVLSETSVGISTPAGDAGAFAEAIRDVLRSPPDGEQSFDRPVTASPGAIEAVLRDVLSA